MEISLVGQLKGCYCLMLHSQLGRIWQEVINEKAGKEVVTDEHVAKVEEVVTENVSKLTEKFGK